MVMKKIIFSTIFFLAIAGSAFAQTSENSSSKTKYTSTASHKAKKPGVKKTSNIKTKASGNSKALELDNRKEYMKNGQLATPTGHDAAPTNGEQFQSLKDTANKKRKKQ
jgi:hypothetical protein